MIALAIPALQDTAIYRLLQDLLRRAVDGTIKPLFVDYTNQRVIVGGTASAGSGAPLQVQSGDVEVTTSGKGVIIKDDGGSGKTCRMTMTYDAASGNWFPTFTTISTLLLALSLAAPVSAANRGIVEGVTASNQTLSVDTTTSRLNVSTGSYSGGLSGVGLHISSDVVISSDSTNRIVLDADGRVRIGTGTFAAGSVLLQVGAGVSSILSGSGFQIVNLSGEANSGVVSRNAHGVEAVTASEGQSGEMGTKSAHRFIFITNNSERGAITSAGVWTIKTGLGEATFDVVGLRPYRPPAQTIGAGDTISANACGGLKSVTANGAVTTSVTDTITAPASENDGCCLDIYNVSTANTITLDQNTNNNLAADTALGPCDMIRACSNGGSGRWAFSTVYAGTCN